MNNTQKLSIIYKSATRLLVVQALYATLINNQSIDYVKENCDKLMEIRHDNEFVNSSINKKFNKKLITSLVENEDNINLTLKTHLKIKENFEINPIVSAVVKVAIAELMSQNTPKAVVISEYVSIAEDITSSGEVKLVNALISAITD